jgi:hypothetical protein
MLPEAFHRTLPFMIQFTERIEMSEKSEEISHKQRLNKFTIKRTVLLTAGRKADLKLH